MRNVIAVLKSKYSVKTISIIGGAAAVVVAASSVLVTHHVAVQRSVAQQKHAQAVAAQRVRQDEFNAAEAQKQQAKAAAPADKPTAASVNTPPLQPPSSR